MSSRKEEKAMTKQETRTAAAAAAELTAEQARSLAASAISAADEAANRCSVGAERAAALLDAFTKLVDRESPTADAVLWALHKALCELQADADKAETHTTAARLALSPIGGEDADQIGGAK